MLILDFVACLLFTAGLYSDFDLPGEDIWPPLVDIALLSSKSEFEPTNMLKYTNSLKG